MTKGILSTKNIAKIAILSAVATILMIFDFSLPFIPPFYKIDFSEVIVAIGAFALGPVEGIIIELLKIILRVFFKPTNTAFIGELTAFLMGIAYIVPSSSIYHNLKKRINASNLSATEKQKEGSKAALKGMIVGIVIATIAGVIINYAIILDMYGYFMGLSIDDIIAWSKSVTPFINTKAELILYGTAPFNLIKWTIVTVLTKIIYKHVSPILHK